jgi:hydrogenase-4 component E
MGTIQFDVLTISSAVLLIATFGVIARRGFMDWLNAYRLHSVVLGSITTIIGYVTGGLLI